jgi:hypothetical protein
MGLFSQAQGLAQHYFIHYIKLLNGGEQTMAQCSCQIIRRLGDGGHRVIETTVADGTNDQRSKTLKLSL